MLKKSLCLVLGFMCIGDMFGSPKELPLGSFNSSGENDLSLCDDSNMYRKETASTRKSLSDVNTQQKKKSRIEECKTNTSKNESKIITIDNDGQKNSDINNVTEYPIDEKEAISSDSNIEPNSGSGSNSNESSFSEDTEVTKNSINNNINEKSFTDKPVKKNEESSNTNDKDLTMESLVDEEISYEQNSLDKIKTIFKNLSKSQLWIGDIYEIKDEDQRNEYIKRINKTLLEYQEYYNSSNRQQYDPRFLFTLMGMLGSHGNKLDSNIDVESILKDLGIKQSQIDEDKRAQGRLIYDWLAENYEDFLGEYYYD